MRGAGGGRGRNARAAAAAASLALHGAALAWLAASVLPRAIVRPPEPPADILVELQRAEAPVAATAAPASPAARPAAATPAPTEAPAPRAERTRSPLRAAPAPPSPSAPQQAPPAPAAPARGPALGPAGGAAPAAGGASARAGEKAPEANIGGFLRATVGCSHDAYMRLSTAERARCDGRFAAAKGAPLPLETDKLAAFSRQALRDEAVRARKEGPPRAGFVPCDPAIVGANLGVGCLPPDAYTSVRR